MFLLIFGLQALSEAQAQNILYSDVISNDVTRTIMSRRSIRKYKSQPVGRDTVRAILECGVNAPNGQNKQSWEIRVVDDKQMIDDISALFVKDHPMVARRKGFQNAFANAPTVVFIAADKNYKFSRSDCGLFGENMIIAAWSMGVGSCFLGGTVPFLTQDEDAVPFMKKLDFSPDYELAYIIALGYPDEIPEAKPRDYSKIRFVSQDLMSDNLDYQDDDQE